MQEAALLRGSPLPSGARISTRDAALVGVALAFVLTVSVFATYAGAALSWDGASLLFAFLDVQDVSAPHGRWSVALLQLPTLLASRSTTDVRALELVYGASYTVIPPAALLLSWLTVHRTHPRLVVWHLLWLCFAALPGQLFFVTESLIAAHLAWPVLFAVLTGTSRAVLLPLALAAAFLFELHPAATLFLLLAFAAAAARAARDERHRARLLLIAATFVAAAVLRAWVSLHDPYEMQQASVPPWKIVASLRLPDIALAAAAVAPLALLVAQLVGVRMSGIATGIVFVLCACFVAGMGPWANDPHDWQDELNYRFVAPLVAAPFLLAAAAVALARPADTALRTADTRLCAALAVAYAAILSLQCVRWLGLRHGLESALADGSCTSMNAIPECRGTALRWWTTPSYALVVQGHAPAALVLPGKECRRRDLATVIPVNPWYERPRNVGWFDLTRAGLPR